MSLWIRSALVALVAVGSALATPTVATVAAGSAARPAMAAAAASAPSLPAGCAQEAPGAEVSCTFAHTGGAQTFEVPSGVTEVDLVAWGGRGATAPQTGASPGGRGALVSGTFPVVPGQELVVTVAGDGANPRGGFGYGNGGASDHSFGSGGGGATGVVRGGDVLLVAGGGGGGGMTASCGQGGTGGDAGEAGQNGESGCGAPGGVGGAAGGAPDANGTNGGQGGFNIGGGGGGGGFAGGVGGQSGFTGPVICCSGNGGGGGGTSHADPSGTNVSLTGLSDRAAGQHGQARIVYAPGPLTHLELSPASATSWAGAPTTYAATGFSGDGADLGDVTADATFSISPDGTCQLATCTPASPGPHTVTATVGEITAAASLEAQQGPAFTSSTVVVLGRGQPASVTVTATGVPAPSIKPAAGTEWPEGLAFTDRGDGTATISGTPSGRPGARTVSLTATNPAGSATQLLRLEIVPLVGRCANVFVAVPAGGNLLGTKAGDRLTGGSGPDVVLARDGMDCLAGAAGRDSLSGQRDADRLRGGPGADTLQGGQDDDVLTGDAGRDLLRAGSGDDLVRAADGLRDDVRCGAGEDRVVADGSDRLRGCEDVRLRGSAG